MADVSTYIHIYILLNLSTLSECAHLRTRRYELSMWLELQLTGQQPTLVDKFANCSSPVVAKASVTIDGHSDVNKCYLNGLLQSVSRQIEHITNQCAAHGFALFRHCTQWIIFK